MHDDAGGDDRPNAAELAAGHTAYIPRAEYRHLDDSALIDLMRHADERAIDEFLIRNQRVLYERVRHGSPRQLPCRPRLHGDMAHLQWWLITRRTL